IVNNAVGSVYKATVFVRNEENSAVHLNFSAKLQTQSGTIAKAAVTVRSGDGMISGSMTEPIELDIDIGNEQGPLSGYLRLASDSTGSIMGAYKYRPIQIAAPLPSPPSRDVVVGALAVAVIVVLVSLVRLPRNKIALSDLMGQPSWNFSDSWGSNI